MAWSLSPEQWAFVALVALSLTLFASVILLWKYRRTLQAAMRSKAYLQPSGGTVGNEDDSINPFASTTDPVPLRIITVEEALTAGRSSTLSAAASARSRHAVMAYVLAGSSQAIVGACMWLLLSKTAFRPIRLATLVWIYCWPVILTWNLLSGPEWRGRIRRFVSYFAGLAVLSAIGIVSVDMTHRIEQGALLWATLALTPTVLLYPTLARPIRAFGPVVLVFMAIAVFGSQVGVGLYETAFTGGIRLPFSDPRFWLLSLAGFLVLGLCAQPTLWYLRRRYERKLTGDIVLTIDCIWLLFALFACEIQADAHGLWRISPLLMFVAYKTVAALSFRTLFRQTVASSGRHLLLLRVFGHRGRTRQLMDLLGARWRRIGSIQLIAGVDLASDYLGIPQFLDFIRGRLKDYFVFSSDDMERRMGTLDLKPDADGRFRVNMFFCSEDTWRIAAVRLIRDSDAILMDLRGFNRANRGCAEELRIIFAVASLQCVLLVIDSETDLRELNNALAMTMSHTRTCQLRILRDGGANRTVAAAIALLDPATKL
jgi:hypothetical protein